MPGTNSHTTAASTTPPPPPARLLVSQKQFDDATRRQAVTTKSRDTLSQLKKALSLKPSEEDLDAYGDKTSAHWDTILGLLAEKHPNGSGSNSMLHYSKALQVVTALEMSILTCEHSYDAAPGFAWVDDRHDFGTEYSVEKFGSLLRFPSRQVREQSITLELTHEP